VLCTRTTAPRLDVVGDQLDKICNAENIELTNRFEPVAAATATARLLAHLLARAAAAGLELNYLACRPTEPPAAPRPGHRAPRLLDQRAGRTASEFGP
jgi:hypothetical protein